MIELWEQTEAEENDNNYYEECDGCCWDCENRTWCWASCTNENYGC